MTADTPARVSEAELDLWQHVVERKYLDIAERERVLMLIRALRSANAITQAQAERIAALEAEVEGLEKALRDLVAYGCPHCPDDRCFGEPRENCPLAAPLAALSALPEAKPAAQAEGE